jgi:hypothetical protein
LRTADGKDDIAKDEAVDLIQKLLEQTKGEYEEVGVREWDLVFDHKC